MILRKHLKKLLSIFGATVILSTFVAKDAGKDKLKELVDSIDTAENAYIMRGENRRNFSEIKRFEAEFEEFRENPTKPKVAMSGGFGGGSSGSYSLADPGEIDWETLVSTSTDRADNDELLDNISRLEKKLDDSSGSHDMELAAINDNNDKLKKELEHLVDVARGFEGIKTQVTRPARYVESERINSAIYDLPEKMDSIFTGTVKLSKRILDDAERGRKSDEHRFILWTRGYYFLYVVGWITGVIGIAIGEEKNNVIEAIADEV